MKDKDSQLIFEAYTNKSILDLVMEDMPAADMPPSNAPDAALAHDTTAAITQQATLSQNMESGIRKITSDLDQVSRILSSGAKPQQALQPLTDIFDQLVKYKNNSIEGEEHMELLRFDSGAAKRVSDRTDAMMNAMQQRSQQVQMNILKSAGYNDAEIQNLLNPEGSVDLVKFDFSANPKLKDLTMTTLLSTMQKTAAKMQNGKDAQRDIQAIKYILSIVKVTSV